MDGSQALDTSLIDTLQGSYPKFQVGIDRVLDQHRHIDTFQTIGQCLHGEWVGRSAGTYPQHIDAILKSQLHMLGCCHLGSCQHAGLFLYLLHPGKSSLAISLEASWLGTWLPHTCTEHVASLFCQLLGGCHNLFLGFGRTWSCYHDGTFLIAGKT